VKRAPQAAQSLPDVLSGRRGGKVFPIEREVRYTVICRRGEFKSGIGKTVNVSSGGVLFAAPEPLAPGKWVKLSISWPAQLDGQRALKLVALGRVMHCQGTNVTVEIAPPQSGGTGDHRHY